MQADGKVDLFEYCLGMVLFSYLDVHFGLTKPPAVRYRTTAAVAQPLTVVLSLLAYAGQDRPEDIQRAFQAGAEGRLVQASLLPREQCTLKNFDAALAQLAQSSPNVKRDVIAAVTACIAADGRVTLEESELLRAVCRRVGLPRAAERCRGRVVGGDSSRRMSVNCATIGDWSRLLQAELLDVCRVAGGGHGGNEFATSSFRPPQPPGPSASPPGPMSRRGIPSGAGDGGHAMLAGHAA